MWPPLFCLSVGAFRDQTPQQTGYAEPPRLLTAYNHSMVQNTIPETLKPILYWTTPHQSDPLPQNRYEPLSCYSTSTLQMFYQGIMCFRVRGRYAASTSVQRKKPQHSSVCENQRVTWKWTHGPSRTRVYFLRRMHHREVYIMRCC